MIVTLIFLNMFIAIILQGYADTCDRNAKMFNNEMRDHFRETWSKYDQDATGCINVEDFPKLMMDLKAPLGWSESYKKNEKKQQEFIESFEIPLNENKQYGFNEVLENLAMFMIVNIEIENEIEE